MTAIRAPKHVLHADPYLAARHEFDEIPVFLSSAEAHSMNHADMERELGERGHELIRTLYQGWLNQKGAGKALQPVIDADGEERTRERHQTRELATTFGSVTVRRTGYGAPGKDSLRPLDATLNLPEELYSLELQRRVALEASRMSFDEVVETIAETTGTAIPKRQVEQLTQRSAEDFDAFYASQQAASLRTSAKASSPPQGAQPVQDSPPQGAEPAQEAPSTAALMVLTVDAKGVVMLSDDLRDETRAAAEAEAAEPEESDLDARINQKDKRHRKRMATVAAVYEVSPHVRSPEQVVEEVGHEPNDAERPRRRRKRKGDPDERPSRPRPQNKRVWASLELTPADVISEAFDEAASRDPTGAQTWVAVVDGNEHQIAQLKRGARQRGRPVTIVLDLFHVLCYLWRAGKALEGGGWRTRLWVLERLGHILHGKAGLVAGGMRRSATQRHLTAEQRKPVDECAAYLQKHRAYMKYDQYLAAGMPIASGVIEGACRHLVQDRMGITGARWRLASAEAVLKLRALRSSGDFKEYWAFHEVRVLERVHAALYHEGRIPPVAGVDPSFRPSA